MHWKLNWINKIFHSILTVHKFNVRMTELNGLNICFQKKYMEIEIKSYVNISCCYKCNKMHVKVWVSVSNWSKFLFLLFNELSYDIIGIWILILMVCLNMPSEGFGNWQRSILCMYDMTFFCYYINFWFY